MSKKTAKKSRKAIRKPEKVLPAKPKKTPSRMGRKRKNVSAGVPLNKFAKWMRAQKLEIEDVAKMIGVSVSSVYGYRRGNRPPGRKRAKVIEVVTKRKVLAGSWD